MSEKLFVYGTLGLGRPNEHILSDIGGTWEIASVRGILKDKGWGAEMGFPGIELNESGKEVEGFVFTSQHLAEHWASLDEFEGEAYQRVIAKVVLDNGRAIDANIYTLRQE
ncbi:gamma-glutamylcyclotransferase family protein [Pseudoalteromonas sp. H105]|uniref:gamma-glutamylcyclotransferase family protein n=1 Tax=Pseudoalteromonas sp. H105 TaxID=1348393 RepID=UPI000731F369|nr:gamma-glutamylcyclotransferase family protein [Pseudoalteromonas sp. H105]KTF18378.1 hypothetical protein ATS75_02915 [Pseudoalteromonas sp. H105]